MAEKLRKDSPQVKGVSADDLKRVISEISRQKQLASEYAGNAGKATSNAVDQHGLEKTALTFARRLTEMEEGKRESVIRSSIEYWHKLGFFSQLSLFDDLVKTLEAILEDIRRNDNQPKPKGAAAEALGQLMN